MQNQQADDQLVLYKNYSLLQCKVYLVVSYFSISWYTIKSMLLHI